MKQIIFISAFLFLNLLVTAQNVGIGTAAPHPSARLEVAAADRGLLIPRIKLKSDTDHITILNPARALLIFNNRDTANVKSGFYYWNDSIWIALTTELNISQTESNDWRLQGNVVQPGTHFLGSTNNAGIPFRINNVHSGLLGTTNTTFGQATLPLTVVGNSNVAIGRRTLQNCVTSNRNVAVGDDALRLFNDDGTGNNTAVGNAAMRNTNGNSAAFNTAVGNEALLTNTVGFYNTALGHNADVIGNNLSNTTVIGSEAKVSTNNTMTFGNSSVEKWAFGRQSTPANQALKVGNGASNGNGAYLTDGGAWTNASDINLKEDIQLIDSSTILEKISAIPITRWKYTGTNEYHIGPMAQDFYAAFNVGLDDKSISTIDPSGVALAAIQVLNIKLEKQTEINKLINLELERIIKRLEIIEKK